METTNIFTEVKFGDKFITRDGRIAIAVDIRPNYVSLFIYRGKHQLWGEFSYSFKDNGILDKEDEWFKSLDIVSKYYEEIDEDYLDDIANKKLKETQYYEDIDSFTEMAYVEGYKDGYRKAKGGINYA